MVGQAYGLICQFVGWAKVGMEDYVFEKLGECVGISKFPA